MAGRRAELPLSDRSVYADNANHGAQTSWFGAAAGPVSPDVAGPATAPSPPAVGPARLATVRIPASRGRPLPTRGQSAGQPSTIPMGLRELREPRGALGTPRVGGRSHRLDRCVDMQQSTPARSCEAGPSAVACGSDT